MVFWIGSSDFWFDLEMEWFRGHSRPRSPVPPAPAAGEPSTSTSSDTLASIKKGLDVMGKAVDGLPIPRLKQVISIISTVLESVEVIYDDRVFHRNQTIIKRHWNSYRYKLMSLIQVWSSLLQSALKCHQLWNLPWTSGNSVWLPELPESWLTLKSFFNSPCSLHRLGSLRNMYLAPRAPRVHEWLSDLF